jgi:osmotically-inducible protein OsmY
MELLDCQEAEIADQADRDLERRVVNFLVGWRMPALRRVDVESHGGTVTLRGEVDSFYQRQLCINCCRRVAGVINLIDKVHVTSD